jgi:ElaB/YqjD/DUF883 family membrane-anchored ribosome-binding protein
LIDKQGEKKMKFTEELRQICSEMSGLIDDIADLPEDDQRRLAWQWAAALKATHQAIEDAREETE